MALEIVVAAGAALEEWRAVHNTVIPTAPLSIDDVAERATRHRLTVAHDDGRLIGSATVRSPAGHFGAATLIVRVLPEMRRKGYGTSYLHAELEHVRTLCSRRVETVVLASNTDGLSFARAHGFVEHDRYVLEGDEIAFVDLHLPTKLGSQQ